MAYIEPQDLRDEGITVNEAHDNFLVDRISQAETLIETLTGRFFEKREAYTIVLDGNNSPIIILDIPPVSITSITEILINDVAILATEYKLIMPNPDSRFLPRLKKLSGNWPKGLSNIEITGNFGFVEANESTPPQVKRLCLLITIWGLPELGDSSSSKAGSIVEETLGDYSYKLSEAARTGLFGDPLIDSLISIYAVKRIMTL